MINFFRKRRKKLADNNKASKYLRYAIGEILLVVVGILIALSINNWNELRKLKKEEVIILKSLLDDLTIAKKQSENAIDLEQKNLTTMITVLGPNYYIETNQDSHVADSIFYSVFWNFEINIPVLNVYTEIKTTGKSVLLSNQDIREHFSSLEMSIFNLTSLLNDRLTVHQIRIDHIVENELNFMKLLKFKFPEFDFDEGENNDYNSLMNNRKIRNLVGIKTDLTTKVLENRKSLDSELISLIKLIELELKK